MHREFDQDNTLTTLTPSAYSCRLAPIFLYTCTIEISSLGQCTSQWTCFFRCRTKRKIPIGLFLSCYCTLLVYVYVRRRSSWFVPFGTHDGHQHAQRALCDPLMPRVRSVLRNGRTIEIFRCALKQNSTSPEMSAAYYCHEMPFIML